MTEEKREHNQPETARQTRSTGEDKPQPQSKPARDVPIVGLGASAGGLEALKAFFAEVSETSGLAYIVLMHLSPDQPSMLPDLLQKVSRIPVTKAKDGQRIEPDHVYAVPARKEISIYRGTIQLLEPAAKNIFMPIDYFFRTLASDKKSNAAAVILSGTGTDGTVGLREIKDGEGLVLAQSKETAKYDGMPTSALHTGLVDMVLAPEDMPQKLGDYFDHRHRVTAKKQEVSQDQKWLNKVFALLRVHAGQDFSFYKTNTIHRRINRRMVLNQVESKETYLSFLRENPNEVKALFRELLIGVTNFFREPESYEILKNRILPKIFKDLRDDVPFRVWVPGCSSGEEVFSLAMVILECLDRFPGKTLDLQIFGSDIDSRAIDKARQGLYPSSIQADVSQERLSRFFQLEGEAYRIRKEVRDRVVFSVQNVLNDPPFSRLNLLSCRNLLIYLNSQAQKKLLPLFHYTLLPGGVMILGSSESIGGFTNLFEPLNATWKIYERKEVPLALLPQVDFPAGKPKEEDHAGAASKPAPEPKADLEQATKNLILARFAPAAVLVDSKGTILHIQGRTGKYLEPASGPPNQNILHMAREGLRTELSLAMRKALGSKEEIVRRQVQIKVNGGTQVIDLHVFPVQKPQMLSGRLLIAFEDIEDSRQELHTRQKEAGSSENESEARIADLEQELQSTRENHQTTVEELESSNEELKSTNEELQSSNEELQSTNEELESSKEELQSLNEELKTVNSELQSKVDELSEAYDDITNLLNSTQIATIFVDNNLRIKRFSQEASKIVNLIESDIGRPLEHQSTHLHEVGLIQDIRQVLDNLAPIEREVQTEDNNWYIMRIMPYRTRDNRIQGAVITFRDVDDQKKSQEKLKELNEQLKQAWLLVRSVFDMNSNPLTVLDEQGRVVIANTALCRLLDLSMQEIEGMDIFSLDKADLRSTGLPSKLQSALQADKDFETKPFQLDTKQGPKTMSIQGQIVRQDQTGRPYRILLQLVEA